MTVVKMDSLETAPIEQYLALFLPFCTSTLSFCCQDPYYFYDRLFFLDDLESNDCIVECTSNNVNFLTLQNLTKIASILPEISYCMIECTSRNLGYIDDRRQINFDKIKEIIDGEFKPTNETVEKCKRIDMSPSIYNGQKYYDSAMKFFFCFWKEQQLGCPKADQKDPRMCEDLQYVLMTGEKPELRDLVSCFKGLRVPEELKQFILSADLRTRFNMLK